jgi:hypothetical protein
MNFFYFACFFQLLDDSREISAAAVLELHGVSNLANGGGVRLSREVRKYFFAADFQRAWFLVFYGVLASHGIVRVCLCAVSG